MLLSEAVSFSSAFSCLVQISVQEPLPVGAIIPAIIMDI